MLIFVSRCRGSIMDVKCVEKLFKIAQVPLYLFQREEMFVILASGKASSCICFTFDSIYYFLQVYEG